MLRIRYRPPGSADSAEFQSGRLIAQPSFAKRFAGKIVFVGVTAQTAGDRHQTPYSRDSDAGRGDSRQRLRDHRAAAVSGRCSGWPDGFAFCLLLVTAWRAWCSRSAPAGSAIGRGCDAAAARPCALYLLHARHGASRSRARFSAGFSAGRRRPPISTSSCGGACSQRKPRSRAISRPCTSSRTKCARRSPPSRARAN